MKQKVAELFVILALNPEKGRVAINDVHFRYSLTGAMIMDFLDQGEISIENKRIVPHFHNTVNQGHDFLADKIMKSKKNRRLSFWIKRFSYKNRFFFKSIIDSLEIDRIVSIEQKKFLNIIPYNKYWIKDRSVREKLIETLRGVLVYGKEPGKREIMLLGLVEASRAYPLLARERGESKLMRKRNSELLKGDIMSSEINEAIKEVHAAIISSVAASSAALHGSH